jgi:predicted ATPase
MVEYLEARFPETCDTQPEVLAHHYTEAGRSKRAVVYWQQVGQRARARSANMEARAHLTKGLEVLTTLPDTPKRTQHELGLQLALGSALMDTKGYAAPEVAQALARA